jgi:hypothetical protein
VADELLRVQTAIGLPEGDVALLRDLAQGVVVRHQMLTELALSILPKNGKRTRLKNLELQNSSLS